MASGVTLRKYQLELAEAGLDGENNIIFAPPGSGKTITAGHIANEVLKKKGKKCKIFFVISVQRLRQQQVDELSKIITEPAVQLVKDTEDLKNKYSTSSVFILTPKILLNGFDSKILKLKDIDLLIVDECQHVVTQHNHHKLMKYYLYQKQAQPEGKLPQVIGLMSSLGFAASVDTNEQLATLCAILDGNITVVKNHVQELEQFNPEPKEKDIKNVPPRDKESLFGKILKDFVDVIESLADFQENPPAFMCGTQQYESWIRTYRTKQSALDTMEALRTVAVCKALDVCSIALHVYHQVQAKSALHVLDQYFSVEKRNSSRLDVEKSIIDKYLEKKIHLHDLAEEETIKDNTKLDCLCTTLNETFARNENSRVLVLTKTIEESKALCDFITSQKEMKHIVTDRFVGQRKKKDGTISCKDQIDIMKRFKKGKAEGGINVLIATDGSKEGMDMPRCDAVIRYNFWNSGIGSLQSKGRLRTKDGKAYVITDKSPKQKRNLATEDTKLAREKIEQWKTSGNMEEDIIKKRREILDRNKDKVEPKKDQSGDNYRIICTECKTELCKGSDILKKGSRYLCTKAKFDFKPREEKIFKHDKIIGVIICKKCMSQLGPKTEYAPNQSRSEGFCFNIKAIQFKISDSEQKCLYFPKWKKVPFQIKEEAVFVAPKISSSKFLDELSEEIGKDWRRIGRRLGIRDDQLDQLEYNNPHNVQNTIYQMLRLWWEERQEKNKSVDARCKELKKAFREVQQSELVEWVEMKQGEYTIIDEQRGPGEEWANHEKYVHQSEIKNVFAELQLKNKDFNNSREDQRKILLKYGHIAWYSICNPGETPEKQDDPIFEETLFQQAAMGYYVSYCIDQNDSKPWDDMENALLTMEKKEERNQMLKYCAKYSPEAEGKTREFYKKAFEECEDSKKLLSIISRIHVAASDPTDSAPLEWEDIKFLCQWKPDEQTLKDFEGQAELLIDQISLQEKDSILSSVCIINDEKSKVTKALKEKKFSLKDAFVLIENDIYPDIEPGQHSIAWLVLEKPATHQAFTFLERLCANSKQPVGICITEPYPKLKELPKMLKLLADCPHVKHVCVDISKEKWKNIKESLEILLHPERKAINKLVLKECLKAKDIPDLVQFIFKSDRLYALDITIPPEELKICKQALCQALERKGQTSLKELGLNLTINDSKVDAETAVSKLLQCSPNLEVLAVKLCIFDFSKPILNLKGLTSLDVSKTCIAVVEQERQGMCILTLFENFNSLVNLKTFNASWCRIDENMITHLNLDQGPDQDHGSELETLHLSYNQLGDKGFEILVEKLKAARNLKKLNVRENQISQVKFQDTMETLEVLDLCHNKISMVCARPFCHRLASCANFESKYLYLQEMEPPIDKTLADEITSIKIFV